MMEKEGAMAWAAHALGFAAVAAGVLLWGERLLEPVPPLPAAVQAAERHDPAGSALAGWFGGGAGVDVVVQGIIQREGKAVALLVVGDAPPRAYEAGEQLSPGWSLGEVSGAGVLIRGGGGSLRIAAPVIPEPAGQGLRRLP